VNKSNFMSAAEEMKEKLGCAMCLAKWQQVSLHLTTGMTNSCYHPPLHEIPTDNLIDNPSSLHNTPYKKEQRKLMLEGKRPEECSYCWSAEDNGQLSDRHYRSGEPWASEHYDEIMSASWDQDATPSYVEVNFNHACNLDCSYCSPQYSSTWQQQIGEYGAYPTSNRHNAPEYFTGHRLPIPNRDYNPYVEAFWEWWPSLYSSLKHFRMTGGEPLLDKNTYKVFNYVTNFPKSDLHIDVTSNFSVPPEVMVKYLDMVRELCSNEPKRIEHFMQYVSLDTGRWEQAEYIRHGMDFKRVKWGVDQFLTTIPYRSSLTFIVTMNNLSLTGLKDLLDWILFLRQTHSKTYQRVWFDTPLLRSPTWQSLQILPPGYAYILEDAINYMKDNKLVEGSSRFDGFKDYEIQRMERNLAWMKQGFTLPKDYINAQRADFYRFFDEYDVRHLSDFESVFPEMRDFWNECKYWANNI